MLEISRHTWHARMLAYTYGDSYLNNIHLCRYFWSVVVAMIVHPFVRLARHIEAWEDSKPQKPRVRKKKRLSNETENKIIAGMTAAPITTIVIINLIRDWVDTLLFLGIFAGTIGFILFCYWICKHVKWPQRRKRSLEEIREELVNQPSYEHKKKKNWFLEYLKAKKQKACPLIKFQDDNSDLI